jgi:Protein of unknown function (DUF3617)
MTAGATIQRRKYAIAEGCAIRGKSIFTRRAGAVVAALLSAVAPAGAIDAPEPGLWSIVTTIGHGNSQFPLRKIERCISAEEPKPSVRNTSVEWVAKDLTCKSTDYRDTDNGGILQIHCAGKTAFDATLTLTVKNSQHYTIVFAATPPSTGQPITWTRTVEGRRLGECAK